MSAALMTTGFRQSFAAEAGDVSGPVKVEIRQIGGRYQLYVDRKPFYIKGAGLESGSQEKLVAHGGNSFRTWGTRNGGELLERAFKNKLYVTMGLHVALERQGFDYDDKAAVAEQLERVKAEVLEFKDHPALIIWAIGNELNMGSHNPAVWNAVNDISKMIHAVDTNHLTTTTLAGFDRNTIREINTRAPDLDVLSFQMYADIVNLPRYLDEDGWNRPYLVTEWGATGHWEVRKTQWGAPIENDSTTKADFYLKRFDAAIRADRNRCLGSYVFLWGHKQERTPTWFGMFLDSGEETAAVDTMEYLWTGAWPAIRCPRLDGAWLDGKTSHDNIRLKPGQTYDAVVRASSSARNKLTYSWELLKESTDLRRGGDIERRPQDIPGLIQETKPGEIVLKAPDTPGAYRLFAYVHDGNGRAAHVNIPFYVGEPVESPRHNATGRIKSS